jgi:predicted protein tyrosine phosphatase
MRTHSVEKTDAAKSRFYTRRQAREIPVKVRGSSTIIHARKAREMKNAYWVEEGRLAGRCGPWLAPFDLEEMHAAGIGYILSLDAYEAGLIPKDHPEIERKLIHLTDSIPPGPGDEDHYQACVPEAVDYLLEKMGKNKRAVLVHCHAGNDRTGTVLAAYLVATQNVTPEDAIERIRDLNPDAVSASGYEEMALDILDQMRSRRQRE